MIIFGWRTRESTADTGEFHCPSCGAVQPYQFRVLKNWFTLYFIPVIPLNKLGEFVRCQGCGNAFRPEVLDREPLPSAARTTVNASSEIRAGRAIELVEKM